VPHRVTLAESFPGAVTYERYLSRVEHAAQPLGFDREHGFAAVSLCRDELTEPLLEAIARRWDRPFNLGGLGALPALGRTGWRAALSHVPEDDVRGKLIVFGFPHLGIDADGATGRIQRRHQLHASATCGAMAAVLTSLHDGVEPLPPGLEDHEADRLRRVVGDRCETPPEGLVELTKVAVQAVDDEIWAELIALRAHEEMDLAVFTGVQVHLPDDVDHIWPWGASFCGADGIRRTLEI